ncbi:MAG: DUF3488 and transglutaminase-like domain-containing protein, partial [Phycisphaerales bacterium]|nr:DUF3488 and transglutaminase-like domain-containing protein [Phycisphaerales bacterium]
GAVLTSNSLPLGVTVLLYTPLAVLSTVMMQLAAGAEASTRAGATEADRAQATPGALALTTTRAGGWGVGIVATIATVLSMTLAVAAFIVTPRGLVRDAMGGWGAFGSGNQVGFSESIRLGESGLLQSSPTPVLEVKVTDGSGKELFEPDTTLYLRGAVLDSYDSSRGVWERTPESVARDVNRRMLIEAGGQGVAGDASAGRVTRVQTVTFRQTVEASTPLFAMYRAVGVSTDRRSSVDVSKETGVVVRSGQSGVLSYRVTSVLDYLEPEAESEPNAETDALRAVETDATRAIDRKRGESFKGGRVRELAERILRENGVSLDASTREAGETRRGALALMAHLRSGFSYSLEMVAAPSGTDPIEMFLFDTKRGHCEYFASAMAAMCLSVDIPARVVTGYAGGEFNSVAGHYTIRRSDAHAWVELKLNPRRWETFDPTPPSDLPHIQRAGGGLFSWLRQMYEAAEFTWVENVVTFDQTRQRSPGDTTTVEWLSSWRRSVTSWISSLREYIPEKGVARAVWIAMLIGGAAITIAALLSGGRRVYAIIARHIALMRARSAATASIVTGEHTRFYLDLLHTLNHGGLGKPITRPPLLHASTLRHESARVRELATGLVERYYALRFGQRTPDADHGATVTRELKELESLLAESPKVR